MNFIETKKYKSLLLIIMILLLCGCSSKKELVGKWKLIESSNENITLPETFEIKESNIYEGAMGDQCFGPNGNLIEQECSFVQLNDDYPVIQFYDSGIKFELKNNGKELNSFCGEELVDYCIRYEKIK